MVKIGRRGSLSGKLTVHGVQGHVAYPHLADNPCTPSRRRWPSSRPASGTRATSTFSRRRFQVSNISAGTGAPNVIPGELKARFNIRFSTEQTVEKLQQTITEILNRHKVNYTLEWFVSGLPFFTPPGELSEAVERAVHETDRTQAGAVDDRRHVRRPLHRADRRAGRRARRDQRDAFTR